MSGVYSCMQPRRGQIFEENPREGTPLIQVKAYLSVSESFSFVAALRQATSGQAFPQCVLDYWEVVPGDGMVEDKPVRDAFQDSVYRRCDISWWSELLLALKVFAGILFPNQSHHMSAIDCIAKLAEKTTALEGVQEFETLFGTASVTGKLSLDTHVPALLEACGHKEKPVGKAKPEVKIVACHVLSQLAANYAESTSLEIEWCVHLLSILMNDRSEAVKRRCCVIVDNMCKLIDDPREGTPLMAEVRGLVEKNCRFHCRSRCTRDCCEGSCIH